MLRQTNPTPPSPRGRIIEIHFNDDLERQRKIVKRTGRRAGTGKFPSAKMGGMIHYESSHEQNAFRLLEVDPSVTHYIEQPCRIRYELNGIQHDHYPDIFVKLRDRKEFWEVKTLDGANKPDVQLRTALLIAELPKHGYEYKLALSSEVGAANLQKNITSILSHSRAKVCPQNREKLRTYFKCKKIVKLTDIRSLGKQVLASAFKLVLIGVIVIDIHQVWTDETVLTWVE